MLVTQSYYERSQYALARQWLVAWEQVSNPTPPDPRLTVARNLIENGVPGRWRDVEDAQ